MDSRCATDPWDAANGPSPGPPDSGAPDPATCQRQLELKSKLLENIGDSIIAHTFDGRIVYANERAAEMLGYAHSEFVNLTAWAWTAPDVRDQVPSASRRFAGRADCCSRLATTDVTARLCTWRRTPEWSTSSLGASL